MFFYFLETRSVEDNKSLVIFYDRCVSRTHLKYAVIPIFPNAKHIYVSDLFSEEIQRDDRKLFEAVDDLWQKQYSGYICFFVTCDNDDFEDAVKSHPAYNNTIHFVLGENVSRVSFENGLRKTQEIAEKIRVKLAEISDKA
ncbi:MAG: hypothetical protein UX07_C0002G0013 [Parcubacteria group bacterium GW2011_GWA2_45_30]|nr:MAG: hypothetical protein UX07_C0002G0013 [Parcubacteria group bacterium GW2011_GWA2_45_30]